jgi:hypothetical protein
MVHNIKHQELGHSDSFMGNGHSESFWLPYLWNIEPVEYQQFLELCTTAFTLENQGDNLNLSIVESEFREKHWHWAGSTLQKCIEEEIYARKGFPRRTRVLKTRVEELSDAATRLIWQAVEEAKQLKASKQDSTLICCLHPKFAVLRAIGAILRERPDGQT